MSIGHLPTVPGGTDLEARWKRSVEERLRALRLMEVPGAIVERTTNGVAIRAKRVTQSGGTTTTGGLNYRGTFDEDNLSGYKKDDVVRVRSGDSQGIWIAVRDIPADPSTSKWERPVFPEPEDTVAGGVNNWELITLGPRATNACFNGTNTTIYANISDPV